MGHQIVVEPGGRLAVWSTVVDDWILCNASPEELLDYYAEEAANEARRRTQKVLDAVLDDRARDVYFQFAETFEELQERRRRVHGSAPWPLEEGRQWV